MEGAGNMLATLLARGDRIAVVRGRLVISPASGKPVPDDWLKEWAEPLVIAAARLAGLPALSYQGHGVGNYQVGNGSSSRKGGLALQFYCLTTGQELYAIFNVDTTRARDTKAGKKGEKLPPGRFRVRKQSAFRRFWESTELPFRRLSDFHDYLGKLKGLTLTGIRLQGGRLEASSLCPLEIRWEELHRLSTAKNPDNCPTSSRQRPDKNPTILPDNEPRQHQQSRGIQPDLTTGSPKCGNKVIREHGYKGKGKRPQDQSNAEWEAEHAAADAGGLHDR